MRHFRYVAVVVSLVIPLTAVSSALAQDIDDVFPVQQDMHALNWPSQTQFGDDERSAASCFGVTQWCYKVFPGVLQIPIFDTEGAWFGACDGFYSNEFFVTSYSDPGWAYRINPITRNITKVGDQGYGAGKVIAELAMDQSDGTLYGVDYSGSTSYLYTINKTTGAASLVGDMGVDEFDAMGYCRDNSTLYGVSNATGKLYTISTTDASTTEVGDLEIDGSIWDIWYDWKSGQLYGVGQDLGPLGRHYVINMETGKATQLVGGPYDIIYGLGGAGPNQYIPSISEWGLFGLALLLIASAAWLLRRSRRVSSTA